MWVGLYLFFGPLLMLIRFIPFIGPFLSSFGGALIWFLTFFTTFIIASAIIVVAYLVFHPVLGLFYGLVATATVGGVIALSHIALSRK